MLLGKLFTRLAFAATAIAPVACTPIAEPDVTTLETTTSTTTEAISAEALDGIQDCGSVFVNIVKLLTDLLNSITGACDTSAIAALIDLVLSLLAHITLISGCLLTNIEGLFGGVLALLAGVLRSLQLDITGCISLFTSACGPYHH
ncbi:uncharacterized protein K444DRAFT_660364 [Hyaloscypha bicolor E]|uniref:Hydrophobin n=1 Tax=Hyaloscypha bicolor E TaxID=1095630 RepID=A0A2J6TNI4_9HELO|nr:uncharacterized protein K444DRAFT_660364 [Hyaloscypha bicolor E]PMD64583.1 hypothetical protein K444DRAFT_660364 [Hyaloscypha bicolor E]